MSEEVKRKKGVENQLAHGNSNTIISRAASRRWSEQLKRDNVSVDNTSEIVYNFVFGFNSSPVVGVHEIRLSFGDRKGENENL